MSEQSEQMLRVLSEMCDLLRLMAVPEMPRALGNSGS